MTPDPTTPTEVESDDDLRRLLVESELRVAEIPELKMRIRNLEEELAIARHDADAANRELAQLDTTWMYLRRVLRHAGPGIALLKRIRRALRDR